MLTQLPLKLRHDRFVLGSRGRLETGQHPNRLIVVDPVEHPHASDTVVVLGGNFQHDGRLGGDLPVCSWPGNRHGRRLVGHSGNRSPDGIIIGMAQRVFQHELITIRGHQAA